MSTGNFLQGRGFQGQTLTICSVFPRQLVAARNYNPEMSGGRSIFKIDAAPKGEYCTMTISDCWELIQSDRSQIGAPEFDPRMVLVQHIANCLLNEWAVNVAGTRSGQRPGIMVISGETPTEEELASLNAMQSAYFDGLINEGVAFAAQHEWRSINGLHRDAAKWRGVDQSEEKYKWVNALGEQAEKKECYWCAEKILARAKFCRHCQREQPAAEAKALPTVHPAARVAKPVPGQPVAA